jgi:hypothetical protein
MVEHELAVKYVAAVILVALTALVLGAVKRGTKPEIVREVVKDALYVYGGAVALGIVAYLICIFK